MNPGVISSIFFSSDCATVDCSEHFLVFDTNKKIYTNNFASVKRQKENLAIKNGNIFIVIKYLTCTIIDMMQNR